MREVRPLVCALLLACAGSGLPEPASTLPPLQPWRPPPAPTRASELRFERPVRVVRPGERVRLRLAGRAAGSARCTWPGGSSPGPSVEPPPLEAPGVLEVICRAGPDEARAQLTCTDAARSGEGGRDADPYAGGVLLLKTRRTPRFPAGPVGTRALGLGSLDTLLERLGAWALPAFPFDLAGNRDRAGIARWIVVDLPETTNLYQAAALLRSDPAVHPQSWLAEDAGFFRVAGTPSWAARLVPPRRAEAPADLAHEDDYYDDYERALRGTSAGTPSRALQEIGAPDVWRRATGRGVLVAVVDSGVDQNHLAVAQSLRVKGERFALDEDGNGVPGDEVGANLAHLVIAHGDGPPHLALGLPDDVSDWSGSGTAVAALVAGGDGTARRLGVAPEAALLAVDVEENARVAAGRLGAPDPRMRDRPAELRSPVWSRAAGIVYAVTEGARVLTCAWSEPLPHWILHDALVFAEDNCALAVCGDDSTTGFPARWRADWLRANGAGTGEVWDAWRGTSEADFFRRPLRATLVVSVSDPGADLLGPASGPPESAASRPASDAAPLLERGLAPAPGAAGPVGLAAGVAALATELRPDLEPFALRHLLREGARAGRLDARGTLELAALASEGGCDTLDERRDRVREAGRPWWQRVGIRTRWEVKDGIPTAPDPDDPLQDPEHRLPPLDH